MTRPVRPHFNQRIQQSQDRARIRNLERRIDAVRFLPVVFDGIGQLLNTGVWGDVPIHIDGTVLEWRLISLQDGDLEIDIWKSDYAGFPPDVSDSITGTDKPLLSSAQKNDSTALTGWTTEISTGDILRFNIDSVTDITKATLTLKIQA